MKKHLSVILATVAIFMFLCACGINNTQEGTDNSMELTARQIELLEELGLPADYNELSLSQKNAISSIEDMLHYLEDKYSKEFKYLGYVAQSGMDKEHLNAYPADGSSNDVVTVYRDYKDGKYTYSDNFSSLAARELFQAGIDEYLTSSVDGEFKAFVIISAAEENVDKANVMSSSTASVVIYLSDSYSEDGIIDFANEYASWLLEVSGGKRASDTRIVAIDQASMDKANKYNYSKVLTSAQISADVFVVISSDGNVQVKAAG